MKTEIYPKTRLFDIKWHELIEYRQLIWIFVKRNYATRYKQMVFGSAWLLISPLLSVISYTVIFGEIAGLSTEGIPKPLFYMASTVLWTFFAGTINANSNTFIQNAPLFGKIYFPRLVVPISNLITSIFDFFIQLLLFVVMMIVYHVTTDFNYGWNITFFLIPLYLLHLGILGVGVGILVSSFTTKYRDLLPLIGYGIALWMYLSPTVYSIDIIPIRFRHLYMLNPVAPVLLAFKYSVLGIGNISYEYMAISLVVSIILFLVGIIIFNQIEKNFMDTV